MAAQFLIPYLPPERWGENDGPKALVVAIAFIAINTFIVVVRFTAQFLTRTRRKWEDLCVVIAYIASLGMCATMIVQVQIAGLGHHITRLQLPQIVLHGKTALAFALFYILGVSAPKMAMLCLYSRIFIKFHQKVICRILIACLIIYSAMAIMLTCMVCIPLEALWDLSIPDARCINIIMWWKWGTLPSTVYDVILLLFPIPAILKLNLPVWETIGISFAFTAGGVGTIASIIRLVLFSGPENASDVSWIGVKLTIVSTVEVGTYLLVICIHTLRPFFLYLRGERRFGSRHSDTSMVSPVPFSPGPVQSQVISPIGLSARAEKHRNSNTRRSRRRSGDEENLFSDEFRMAIEEPSPTLGWPLRERARQNGILVEKQFSIRVENDRTTWV